MNQRRTEPFLFNSSCISLIFTRFQDVIEEEALNEKSCIQVLRILIAKSDNEIEGLEGELLFLKTHLERADKNKAEEWFDICCKELNENIQSLELSINSLKDGHVQIENENDVQSRTTSREPAKNVYDIIKEASLRDDVCDKHKPPADTTIEDLLDTVSSQVRNDDSINITAEEVIESSSTAKDQITKERMRLNQHEAMEVQEAVVTNAVNTHFSDSSLVFQGQDDTNIVQLAQVEGQRMRLNQHEAMEVQEAVVTDAVKTHFSDSSLVFQGQDDTNIVQLAQVEGQEPTPVPATHKAFRLIPSLKLQEQETKSIIPSEISKGQGKKARPNRKTMPKCTPKTVMKTPKAPTIPETPKSRTQSDPVVQKSSVSSVKSGGVKKRKQEQLDGQWFTSGNKVSRIVMDDVLKPGDALTHSKTHLISIFKSEEKTNSHGTMQLDAVEVKDSHGSLRTSEYGNLHAWKLQNVKDLAKSLGLKGLADKRKDVIIKSIEEHKGRQL